MIRVLLIDDQALVRAGFRMILDAEPHMEVVGEAADGREAIERVRATRPDVVLMDIRMPELDGLGAGRRILAGGDDVPKILMLTTFDLDEYVYEALHAGASGFLLKDTPPEQLVVAIEVVANGEALLSPTITRRVIAEFVKGRGPKPRAHFPRLEDLTARELEVLQLIELRRRHPVFSRTTFFEGRGEQLPDVWWMRPDGRRMTRRDWDNAEARAIGVFLNGEEINAQTRTGDEITDASFLLLFNAHYEEIHFRLPARRFGTRWELELATGRVVADRLVPGGDVAVESRSLAVFRRA